MHSLPASSLWLYFVLVAGIIVLPGMDMAFVMASALAGGRRAGLAAVGGIVAGGWLHLVLGAIGIGLLLQAAPGLFEALLFAGALYVGWIGLSLLRGATALGEAATARRPALATFGRALATCLLNPKAYLFTLAVFPQFLRTDARSFAAQALSMGAITSFTQVAVYGAIALAAAGTRAWLVRNPQAQRRIGHGVGLLLIAAAAWTAAHGLR
ncbi:MAG: LysE family translocator [Burkholderiales bacterium]|nr:LysE family translocator [Burkholderiales bacterium]